MADDLPIGAEYPTPKEVLATMLNGIRYAYGKRGVSVNVAEGSELYERAWAVAQRVSLAIGNGRVELRNTNPVDATGDALITWAATFGVFPRPAAGATGFGKCTVNAPAVTVPIPEGFVATAPNGEKYDVSKDFAAVANNGQVELVALGTGPETDQDADTILTWDSASIAFLSQKCKVTAGGLDGGRDADSEEVLRARLLRRLSFPAVGGNWSHVATLAEDASAAVEFAAVYESARGPSSYDVAIVGSADDPVLNTATQNQVAAAIVAEMPGSANLNLTSISLEPLDVVINTGLPLPQNAGGEGGGWYDALPWPSTNETAGVFARVTDVLSNYSLEVDSTSADPPVVGKRFAIWDPVAKEIKHHAIVSVLGSSGAYIVFIDSGFTPDLSYVQVGMYISAGAALLQSYAEDFIESVNQLGPGEKTDNPDILQYAIRKPKQSISRPSALTSLALTDLQSKHSEISDVSYAARYEALTTVTRTKPPVPSVIHAPTRQLSLSFLSFRAQV
jgi:uncharacterized phage protein gp47/JayE